MADLDPDTLSKLRVVDLREHLSSRGLPTSGLKAELVNRLREALLTTEDENADAVEQNEEQMEVDRQSGSSTDEEPSVEEDDSKARDEEEERARLQAEEEARARLQAEEEERARLQAEEEARARLLAEEEERARLQAQEEARAEEEARILAEEASLKLQRYQAKLETRLRAEGARLQAEEEARLRAEEEARIQAEEEFSLQAEEKTRLLAEELRAEVLRAEEVARLRAEENARLQYEEQVRLRAEEEARLKAEEEARHRAEREARVRAREETRLRAEEEARLKAEEEARLQAAQDFKVKIEEEEVVSRPEELRQEEETRLQKEGQAKESEEEDRKKAERLAVEEEMRLEQEKWLVVEQMRKAQEEHKRRLKEEEDRRRQAVEDARRAREEERQKKRAEEEERRKKAAEEREEKRRIAEEERKAKAAEKQRIAEEKAKLAAEKQAIEDEQKLLEDEEIKLPQAIEKVLALKSERAQLLGEPDTDGKALATKQSSSLVSMDEEEAEEEEPVAKNKESKSKRKRKKKKKRSQRHQPLKNEEQFDSSSKDSGVDVDIEYVQEVIHITDPMYSQFMKIFERFKLTDVEKEKAEAAAAEAMKVVKEEGANPLLLRKKPMDIDEEDEDSDGDNKVEEEKPKMSKRKLKKLSRMTVAELKQKVNRPELVEMHDVTAKDPVLLLHLKASRNTVPVPRHWCFKRKYLQGKRGIEKPAFELPDFIKRTGIMEMRQALQEKEDQKTMKAKMRERVRPKLGKIDIDYQKLHDAFFKWQTKPKMTIHGDLYYEGKEFETRLKEKKPGDLSEDLRTALGMPTGPNANKCPPPWLIAMQRYGPPPSYPNLKIPGLNAPIPEDCTFGYHAGGWGKPPVDETGRPLYGDVFGTQMTSDQMNIQEEEIDHTLWGELESESSEESEEEEDEEEDEDEEKTAEDESGLVTPAEGLITPSGFSSIPTGMETPDMIELRKRKIESEIEGGETPALYTILPEKKGERIGAAMMGSTHTYDLAAAIPAGKSAKPGTGSVAPQGIEVALDPSELEMDSAAMAARYEQTMREQQSQLEKEDLSDMVAEHAARQKNKRKKQQMTSAKPPKKYKEFKF